MADFPALDDEVERTMAEVLPSEDPLDAPDFDPVAYMNARFPNERSLPKLDPFIAEVGAQIAALDDDISEAVHAQAEAGERAARDIADARAAMAELQEKVVLIKRKAEESEEVVREICRDIKRLDTAKTNLQGTITALKRMHMLTSAILQLKAAAAERNYGEAAGLLEAIGHLLRYFAPYGEVPRIKQLSGDVGQVRDKLRDEVFEAFERAALLSESSTLDGFGEAGLKSVAEACQVVDALGPAARERQVAAFVERQLEPYAALFPRGGASSGLDDAERRFAWIRRVLKAFDAAYGADFPAAWLVEKRLVLGFAERTRAMFLEILGAGANDAVAPVLKALQRTLVFEKEAQGRVDDAAAAHPYEAPGPSQYAHLGEAGDEPTREDAAAAAAEATAADALADLREKKVTGSLSKVFDPFMDPYVALERQNMEDMRARVTSEDHVDRDGARAVFGSSVHVFAYIKTSVRRCTALTSGQTFYKLHRAFCDCLRDYATRLRGLLEAAEPRRKGEAEQTAGAKLVLDAARRADPDGDAADDEAARAAREVDAACYCLNTAEYCAETVAQLGEIVRGKIDDDYKAKVTTEAVEDAFHEAVAAAVRRLVDALAAALEPALREARATNWGALEIVDEESPYVRLITRGIRDVVPRVRALVSGLYFRNFCDKFAAAFLPRVREVVTGAKRINEMGTHQLLLDLHSLKPALLELPACAARADGPPPPPAPAAYARFVAKQLARLEMLLKLVGTPTDLLVERFRIMWADGGPAELQTVANLKGLKKHEVQHLLDTFGGGNPPAPAPEPAPAARGKTPPPPSAAATMSRLGSSVLDAASASATMFRKA